MGVLAREGQPGMHAQRLPVAEEAAKTCLEEHDMRTRNGIARQEIAQRLARVLSHARALRSVPAGWVWRACLVGAAARA